MLPQFKSKRNTILSISYFLIQIIILLCFLYGLFKYEWKLSSTSEQNQPLPNNTFFIQQKYEKLVLILIDSERFDLAYYNDSNKNPNFYQNKMKIFDDLMTAQPQNSLFFRVDSGAPDFTELKIVQAMTGTYPPISEVANNVQQGELEQDSLIKQAFLHNKQVFVSGDNTWKHLFSKYLSKGSVFKYNSFNIFRVYESDALTVEKIPKVVKDGDTEFVIGHLQGVDHISHAINKLDLKEMADMLDFHNKFVSEVISSIDENTLFVAFSDHGMWENGLHGTTGFFNETDTFMFAYTKKGFFLKNQVPTFPELELLTQIDETHHKRLNYVDLTSTMASSLGISIPFSNAGQIILDLYPQSQALPIETLRIMARDSLSNLKQIFKLADAYYLKYQLFTEEEVNEFEVKLEETQKMFTNLNQFSQEEVVLLIKLIQKTISHYHTKIQSIYRVNISLMNEMFYCYLLVFVVFACSLLAKKGLRHHFVDYFTLNDQKQPIYFQYILIFIQVFFLIYLFSRGGAQIYDEIVQFNVQIGVFFFTLAFYAPSTERSRSVVSSTAIIILVFLAYQGYQVEKNNTYFLTEFQKQILFNVAPLLLSVALFLIFLKKTRQTRILNKSEIISFYLLFLDLFAMFGLFYTRNWMLEHKYQEVFCQISYLSYAVHLFLLWLLSKNRQNVTLLKTILFVKSTLLLIVFIYKLIGWMQTILYYCILYIFFKQQEKNGLTKNAVSYIQQIFLMIWFWTVCNEVNETGQLNVRAAFLGIDFYLHLLGTLFVTLSVVGPYIMFFMTFYVWQAKAEKEVAFKTQVSTDKHQQFEDNPKFEESGRKSIEIVRKCSDIAENVENGDHSPNIPSHRTNNIHYREEFKKHVKEYHLLNIVYSGYVLLSLYEVLFYNKHYELYQFESKIKAENFSFLVIEFILVQVYINLMVFVEERRKRVLQYEMFVEN